MRRTTLWLLVVALGPALFGCGDDGGPSGGDAGSGEDVMYDEAFAGTCTAALSCTAQQVATACTCVDTPLTDSVFETNRVGCGELPTEMGRARIPEDDFCDPAANSGPPDLTCMMPGRLRTRGAVTMVTLYGVVDVFGNGGNADAITVEVYEEAADGNLGTLLGSATAAITSACSEREDEIDNDMVIGTRELGFYSIANIPTETPLIIKTSGNPDFWKDLYTYNFQITNDEVVDTDPAMEGCDTDVVQDCTMCRSGGIPSGARHKYRARVLSRSDYNSIPLTAGVPAGITRGNGAVAGEVHDCGNVRLEFAQVGVSPLPETLVYFNDNPSNPLPQMGRTEGTSLLGLYAALDLPPGPVDVAAVGRVGGSLVSLGWYRVRVFADSVSAVSLRGLRWQQTGE